MTEQQQQEIAAYNNAVSAYNAESQAFSEELQEFHTEQGQCNTVLQELRQFQSAFKLDRIDGKAWNQIKNWNSWKGHMTSEFSKELRARYKAWVPKGSRAEHNTTHYPCWHCGLKTYLSNQCMNWACSENHLLQEENNKQKAEMDELAKQLLEAQDQLKQQSTPTASPTVDIDKLKEQLAEAKQINEKQETEFKEVMEKKTHLQTEADEYAKQIVFYGQSLSDMEKEKKRMTDAIASQNKFVTEMVGKERQHKQELQQATSQITTLKQLHKDNLKISMTKEKEMTRLRQELEATQNKMAELGIERDVPEDKDLEEAIAMSKTAEATAESSQAPIAPKARPAESPVPVAAPAAKAPPPPPLGFELRSERPEGEPMDVAEDPDPDNMD